MNITKTPTNEEIKAAIIEYLSWENIDIISFEVLEPEFDTVYIDGEKHPLTQFILPRKLTITFNDHKFK